MKKRKFLALLACCSIAAGTMTALSSCNGTFEGILLWGPAEHAEVYTQLWQQFITENPEYADIEFQYGNNGDAGAYDNLAVDPQSGASIYTFANDQLANIRRIGAIAPVAGQNEEWILANHSQFSCDAGKIDNTYYAYPVSQDNGFVFCYSKDAFRDTAVWDETTDSIRADYTFRDLFAALDERGTQEGHEKWGNGLVLWPCGSAWYEAGVFFATGGDYSVEYDKSGNQVSAECSFGYTESGGQKDYTIGLEAARCMVNSYTNEDGTVSKHFMYTDDNTPAYNDIVSQYITNETQPLAGIISWNNGDAFSNWGDDYDATILPMLESDTVQLGGTGEQYRMKTFGGCKLMGVNPYSAFARKSPENLQMLHDLAKFMTGYDASMARFESSGLAPSNLEAAQNEDVLASPFVEALNAQMALTDENGNEIGYRVQDSTPTNFWDPIAAFGLGLFTNTNDGTDNGYGSEDSILPTLENLQSDIESATV